MPRLLSSSLSPSATETPSLAPPPTLTMPRPLSSFLSPSPATTPVPRSAARIDDAPPPFPLPVFVSSRNPLRRPVAHIDPVSLLDSKTSFSSSSVATAPSFPELETGMERSIAALGGAAFPNLNWSAPKDAAWISADGTVHCTSFVDVVLGLCSSDAIAHDLSHALTSCRDNEQSSMTTFHLALRKWYPSLRSEMEFRCFARRRHHRRRLVGISQHEVTGVYPVLIDHCHEI